jgi:phosphate transport system ATP-binding protein
MKDPVAQRPAVAPQAPSASSGAPLGDPVFELRDVTVSYSGTPAVEGIDLDVHANHITALIGPSGCGKSTVLRCMNRMNDLVLDARVGGQVLYHGQDIYASHVDPVEVRKLVGMVFQKPNPFPKSIYDNIAFGPRVLGMDGEMD